MENTLDVILAGINLQSFLETYLMIVGIGVPLVVSIKATKKGVKWLFSFINKA
ncbi:MAG: hypothetical protein WDA12_01255 [Bacilli bacterium]